MSRTALALLGAWVALSLTTGTADIAVADGIDIVGPEDAGRDPWNGDRMRGARERLKDILPGRFG